MTMGELFNDGAYILYVNGEYCGDSEIGKLMHDFNCTDADDMNFALMAERTRYLKENPEGVKEMCKAMEDMRNNACEEGKVEERLTSIRNLMETMKWTAEQAMDALLIPVSEHALYAHKLSQ